LGLRVVNIVPRNIQLTPTIVRQWYIGDGCLKKTGYNPCITFATDGFVRDDVNFLIKQFNKLGFKATINKGSKNKDKEKGYIVRILVESTEPLLQYIGPCPKEIDSIYGYKWQYNT
jgi:hypothetical protein